MYMYMDESMEIRGQPSSHVRPMGMAVCVTVQSVALTHYDCLVQYKDVLGHFRSADMPLQQDNAVS